MNLVCVLMNVVYDNVVLYNPRVNLGHVVHCPQLSAIAPVQGRNVKTKQKRKKEVRFGASEDVRIEIASFCSRHWAQ